MPQADGAPRVNCTADAPASRSCWQRFAVEWGRPLVDRAPAAHHDGPIPGRKGTRTSGGSGPGACSGVGSFCSIGGWAGG
jgi:hypothetical protein